MLRRSSTKVPLLCLFLALCLLLGATAATGAEGYEIQVKNLGDGLSWNTNFEFGSATLVLTGPKKYTYRAELGREEIVWPVGDGPDGRYTWEIQYLSPIDSGLAAELEAARAKGNEQLSCDLVDQGVIESPTFSGSFVKIEGELILPDEGEEEPRKARATKPSGDAVAAALGESRAPTKDQVILDDLIVDGSACIGFDCVNGEAFGFDTIRLKENNLRIKFDDTSVGAFPATDWQLTANDSASGGAGKFSIDDISGGRTPFTVEANSPSHSLYVDNGGRVGFGTSTPVVDLHVKSGNTPTLRLEQDTSSGFAAQTWDVASNETNFFVRDATNGSTLPFRIRPGASSNQIFIDSNNEIGIGTASPDAKLDIEGVDAGASALSVDFNNTSTGVVWFFQNDQDETFKISREGSGGAEMVLRARQDPGGSPTLTVDGSVQATNVVFASSRALKTDFRSIDGAEVLAKLARIPIQEWRFATEDETVRHVGPIAEDFAAAFGLGQSERHINVTDINGVALAAIQGLAAQMKALEAQNDALSEQNRALVERLERLEASSTP